MTQLDRVEAVLRTLSGGVGVTAGEVAGRLELSRSTASRYLNALTQRKRAVKQPGRPVRYLPAEEKEACPVGTSLIRPDGPEPEELFSPDTPGSLQPLLREAMAAVMYPPHGLPLLLHGETGVGKSHLAHTLYRWVLGKGRMGSAAPYISFNCADYAQNPDLLLGQLFGVKRGAYTGASDRPGLVERAAGGILFLDEIHRLPPAGQEMLFHLIDQGRYRRLGETEAERISRPLLIGATTEDPSSVLLPALLRRFALRLTLPPLRERTREERERLLDHFLRREAKEMRMPLAVDPECRRALLTYDCRGNTGQLRSDIQTACARAFLRRLHHGEDRVVLRQEDLPEPAAAVLKQTSSPGDESASAPLPPRQPASPSSLYGRLTLLARELEERGLSPYEKIRRLQELADRHLNADPSPSEQRWTDGLIDADLMKWVRETAAAILSDGLSPRAMTALGLHIQALLTEGRPPARPSLPLAKELPPSSREAARHFADRLERRHEISLPEGEIDLIALLLSPRRPADGHRETGAAVLVAAHGDSAARSMTEVANALLGENRIRSVDMPLSHPPASAFERIREAIRDADRGTGVLMLTDIGSLTTIGEAVSRETGIPVETLTDVSLSMVIDAGRKSLLPGRTLASLAETVRQGRLTAVTPAPNKLASPGNPGRVIATLCLTGEGAALTLETWIRKRILPAHPDVRVRPVSAESGTGRSPLLEHLAGSERLIAVVGTVTPELKGVPFIPAWELLQPEGPARLERLLEATRPDPSAAPSPVELGEIPFLAEEGLCETAVLLNPRLFCRTMEKVMAEERPSFSLDPEREMGLWIHLGLLTDRLLRERVTGEPATGAGQPAPQGEAPRLVREAWGRVLERLSLTFHLDFPPGCSADLARLSRREVCN